MKTFRVMMFDTEPKKSNGSWQEKDFKSPWNDKNIKDAIDYLKTFKEKKPCKNK